MLDKKTTEFYNKYITSNPKLMELEVYPLENIKGARDKTLFSTKYGEVIYRTRYIKENKIPTIVSALDQTDYFLQLLKKQNFHAYNNLQIMSDYKGMNKKILFVDKFGTLAIEPTSILRNHPWTIESAVDKTSYFINFLKYKNPYAEKMLKKIKITSSYIDNITPIFFEDKYGECSIRATSLYYNNFSQGHFLDAAINKTKYWINMAKKVHGEKYDYSSVKIKKSTNEKVKIICKDHGVFIKQARLHSTGYKQGCPKCTYISRDNKLNISQAQENKTDWKNIRSEFYIIKFEKDKELFYKIGVTTQFEARYRNIKNSLNGYKIEEIERVETNLYDCTIKEQETIKKLKKFQYIPSTKFAGYTECFSVNPLDYKDYE